MDTKMDKLWSYKGICMITWLNHWPIYIKKKTEKTIIFCIWIQPQTTQKNIQTKLNSETNMKRFKKENGAKTKKII